MRAIVIEKYGGPDSLVYPEPEPMAGQVVIEINLPWPELAAIPETYATAWTCLFRNLEITPGQTLVIRGANGSRRSQRQDGCRP
jgi:NADPH:quinone reductase-like Zn-dependent oxidoreductase